MEEIVHGNGTPRKVMYRRINKSFDRGVHYHGYVRANGRVYYTFTIQGQVNT